MCRSELKKGGEWRSGFLWKRSALVWRLHKANFPKNPSTGSVSPFDFTGKSSLPSCTGRRNFCYLFASCSTSRRGFSGRRWHWEAIPMGLDIHSVPKLVSLLTFHKSASNITHSRIAAQITHTISTIPYRTMCYAMTKIKNCGRSVGMSCTSTVHISANARLYVLLAK